MTTKTSILTAILAVVFSSAAAAQTPAQPVKPKAGKPAANPVVPTQARAVKGEPLEFPEIDGWSKGDKVTYPSPDLGYSVTYRERPGNVVSIYIYNGGRKDIGTTLTGAVKQEIARAQSDIEEVARAGTYSDVKLEKDEQAKLSGTAGKIDTLKKVFSLTAAGNAMRSEIILFPFDGNFVKIRASRLKSIGPDGEKAVNHLMGELEAFFVMYIKISDASRKSVK